MNLTEYLTKAVSPYHCVDNVEARLRENGFKELDMKNPFLLREGGKYYTVLYGSSLVAFTVPDRSKTHFVRMACAHTDYPCLMIKPSPDLLPSVAGCRRINVEPYGGVVKKTWFDRSLGVAGRVFLKGKSPFEPQVKTYCSFRPVCVIPSLAPHMDRDAQNKDVDAQKELVPVFSLEGEEYFIDFLARELGVESDKILSWDLRLYSEDRPHTVGNSDELVVGQGIDNVASVAALTEALIASSKDGVGQFDLIALFDNEEIGSRTKQGADSDILTCVLHRIFESEYFCDFDKISVLMNSTMLSADGAHAKHPNYPDKSDPVCFAELGKGLVIKQSAAQRYATDARLIAMIKDLCGRKKIPVQIHTNRSGAPGGQTMGPIVSAYLPIPTTDVGIPMLGMHSIHETCSGKDYEDFCRFFTAYFS